jgi:integrase
MRRDPNDPGPLPSTASPANLRPWLSTRPGIAHRESLVREIFDLYLRLEGSKVGERHREEVNRLLALFARDHGDKPVCALKPADLLLFIQAHPEWKEWTIKRVVAVVKRPFNWAVKMQELRYNPLAGVTHAAGERRRPMTDAEFRTLQCNTTAVFRRVLVFLRLTGARPGELAMAQWSDLDLERGVLTLRRHKTVKKTRRPRIVPLTPALVKLLIWLRRHRGRFSPAALRMRQLLAQGPRPAEEVIGLLKREGVSLRMLHIARRKARVRILPATATAPRRYELCEPPGPGEDLQLSPFIFLHSRGEPWRRNALCLRLLRLRKRCGIAADCKLYGLRHAFATRAVLNKLDLATLAELLGHTSTRTTEHYLHLAGQTDHLIEAVKRATQPKPL